MELETIILETYLSVEQAVVELVDRAHLHILVELQELLTLAEEEVDLLDYLILVVMVVQE